MSTLYRTGFSALMAALLAAGCAGSPEAPNATRTPTPGPVPALELTKNPEEFTLVFGGDTHFQWGVAELQQSRGMLAPVERIRPIFAQSDFRVLNLETTLSDRGQPYVQKSYIFNSSPDNIQALRHLNLDLALLGNNHSMDMGKEGLELTIRYLRQAGIASVGAGVDLSQAASPYVFERDGVRFAILSFSMIGESNIFAGERRPGVALGEKRLVLRRVAEARREADLVIVSLHWGHEYYNQPDAQQVSFARRLIDSGAKAVIGHHPHVPQGVELYRGGVICYSLGNFVFGSVNEFQQNNILARLEVNKKKKRIERIRVLPISGIYRDAGHAVGPLPADQNRIFWQDFYALLEQLSPATARRFRVEDNGTAVISVQGK